jgi:hypothetical protein
MPRILKTRPSPAFIISVIALIFALGGGLAFAKLSDGKKDKKVANKVVTKRAPSLSVLHAKTADSATTATTASGPIAYAHVNQNGTVDASNSKGVTSANVTKPAGMGIYCFHGLSFPFKGAQVTTDFDQSTDFVVAQLSFNLANCPAGNQLDVETGLPGGGGTSDDTGFYIMFYS